MTPMEAIHSIFRRGVTVVPGPNDRLAPLDDLARSEALRHEQWSAGMSPDEYLLALVDRAQARKAAGGDAA